MMPQPTLPRSQLAMRRLRHMAALAGSMLIVWFVLERLDDHLVHSAWYSGYGLLVMVLFLAAFPIRKRLSFFPGMGSASAWMQGHIYIALLSGWTFAFHMAWRVPDGSLERLLAIAYGATFLSGCYGLMITRSLPVKLSALRNQVIYERIPLVRQQIAEAAQRLVQPLVPDHEALYRFYVNRVAGFLHQPRSWVFMAVPSHRECRRLCDEIASLDRFLAEEGRVASRSLMQLVREKDDADYHWALQSRLKYWLVIHIVFTYGLLTLTGMHVILTHAFGGGLR